MKIKNIKLRNILNSNGENAIEIEMISQNNSKAIASSPSAIIPGRREILTTQNLSRNITNEVFTEICNKEIESQKDFDIILDKYIDIVGSNISLPLSLAFARLMARKQELSLVQYIRKLSDYSKKCESPRPLVAIFSGGVHNRKQEGSIQNIMIAVDLHPFSKSIQAITEIYSYIEHELKERNILDSYGSSSGMVVQNLTVDEKFEMLENAIKTLNYEENVSIAIDVAAEHFYKDKIYTYKGQRMNSKELCDVIKEYINKYNISYVEDPFDSDDEKYWEILKTECKDTNIIGDDLFATQDKYINSKLANGIIIKMNQVGTLTGTINAYNKAKKENMIICVSQRSIETEDTFMCDLAVALGATYIKIGGPRRGDRIIKYNQLLRLEENEIGEK